MNPWTRDFWWRYIHYVDTSVIHHHADMVKIRPFHDLYFWCRFIVLKWSQKLQLRKKTKISSHNRKKFSIKSYDKFIFKVFFAFSLVQLYQQDSNTYIHVHYFCCALVGRFDVFWLAYGWFIIIKAIGCSLGGRCKAIALWVGLNCYVNYVDFSFFFIFKSNWLFLAFIF